MEFFKKNEEVGVEDLERIAEQIKHFYENERDEKVYEIRRDVSIKNKQKKIQDIKDNYKNSINKDPVIVVAKKTAELEKLTNVEQQFVKLNDLIEITGNKKALKGLKKDYSKARKERWGKSNDINQFIQNNKLEFPRGMNYSEYIGVRNVRKKDFEGFVFEPYVDKEENAIESLYRFVSSNLNKSDYVQQTNSKNEKNDYAKNKLEEIESVKKFWYSKHFKEHLAKISEENSDKANKFKTEQAKKMQEIEKIEMLYSDLSNPETTKGNIDKALAELRSNKVISEKARKKIEKSLLKQREKEIKKIQKIKNKANKLSEKIGLSQSINKAKLYEGYVNSLEGLPNEKMLDANLEEAEKKLKEAEEKLEEENAIGKPTPEEHKYEVKNGDVYETGEIIPASNTNAAGIYAAEKNLEQKQKELAHMLSVKMERNQKESKYNYQITELIDNEITSTINHTKTNPSALPAPLTDEYKNKFDDMLKWDGIDHSKEGYIKPETSRSKDEKSQEDNSEISF